MAAHAFYVNSIPDEECPLMLLRLSSLLGLCLSLLVVDHCWCQRAPTLAAANPQLTYTTAFFADATYDSAVPTQRDVIGFDAGTRAATTQEIERCLQAWTKSPRTRLVEYARSHENRPLHYVVVSTPANLARIDEIQQGMARLANPRDLADDEAERLISELPAVAWLAYNIHGDETEGADAALAVLYHLVASTDPATEKLLDDLLVVIDPVMNPDGRDRFLKMVAEHRGLLPDVDDGSLVHTGYWPRGRGNHYLFDLNRDWIFGVHPETRGRIREIGKWHPLLFVDAHGMGSQETHLFSPPRQPINPNLPLSRRRWARVFAQDQAAAFDRQGWTYYHGEWNEEWYPGYSDSWASYRGAVGVLYEQASIAEDGVLRPEGRVLTYRESVHHHVVGSMANLATLQEHANQRLRDFWQERRRAISPDGRYSRRTFAILPSENESRLRGFVELMQLQGIEVYTADSDFTAQVAIDQLGRQRRGEVIPAGSVLIPNRQPLAHLVAVMLDFDIRFSDEVLKREREELLLRDSSRIYDTTAWNLTMLRGLEALQLPIDLPAAARPYATDRPGTPGLKGATEAPVAYVIDGADDLSVAAAAHLMEQQVEVRVARKPFQLDGQDFARGSVVVTALDNRARKEDLGDIVDQASRALGLVAVATQTGLGDGDLPDLGGEYFTRLERPRIALLGRGGISAYDYGSLWYVLDQCLGIPHSRISEESRPDLRRYNVLIVPDRWGQPISSSLQRSIVEWARSGGTLIAIGGSAAEFAREEAKSGSVRVLSDVLDQLDQYELAVYREWMGRTVDLEPGAGTWSHSAPQTIQYPWQSLPERPSVDELKRRDAWQRIFTPQGVIVATRVDDEHWLTAGCRDSVPVLIGPTPVLMSAHGVDTPIRLGIWSKRENQDAEPVQADSSASQKQKQDRRIGFTALPDGYELYLRMSGLLWPEAAHRLANAAYVTRESLGRGQVILFAASPTFRASTLGSQRVLTNAVVFGPGCGTAPQVEL
jgi:hypothetical protein